MKRAKHSLSNYKLFSCDMGELVPINVMEVLPGDSVQLSTSALVRCSPLIAPVMHPVHAFIRHFYVPNRLIWEDWEDFITGGPDGHDTSVYPTMSSAVAAGDLLDYMGLPISTPALSFSALPIRAYMLIYNEYYRDQDLQTEVPLSIASGLDSTTVKTMRMCNWEKDYFTSARPWEQKGPTITIPLGTEAPVKSVAGQPINLRWPATGAQVTNQAGPFRTKADRSTEVNTTTAPGGTSSLAFADVSNVYADLTNASAVTVNILREAMALQRYEEARARFGSRYTEYLRYLGVTPSDARLQRPEYLGGGRQTIQFSEVLQTAEGTDPVGDLKGHGIAAMRSNRFRRFFEEHGWVISLMSVKPKTMYHQGMARHWNRRSKEDFWQKELQHIGQQEILNKELYAAHPSPDGIFGYQDRYDEYRRTENTVAGEFQTSTLDYWHFARSFGSAPALNDAFVTCLPTEKPFAAPSMDVLYVMAHHSIQARRMVAKTGTSFIF